MFEGGGHNTLQINNVTTNTTGGNTRVAAGQGGGIGNIGVGGTGLVSLSGPGTINGNLDVFALNTGQVTGSGVMITGTTSYGVAAVASALNTVNTLSATLGAEAGAPVSINGTHTLLASSGKPDGSGNLVFSVSSLTINNGQTLTIDGSGLPPGTKVVLNFTSNTQIHGNVLQTGGLTPSDVLFNVYCATCTTITGGFSLDINNGGGSPSNGSYLSEGIFLDPDGAINVTNSNITGYVFGGDSHDFQYVSGSNITAPLGVPEPSTMLLLGMGLLGMTGFGRRRKVQLA